MSGYKSKVPQSKIESFSIESAIQYSLKKKNTSQQADPYKETDLHEQVESNSDQQNLTHQIKQKEHRVINYRPDIDGIRAIAILLVLIYHAFPQKLTGGFIGVDVFFVISGFLITQIITKQIIQEKFTILDFYCRRIKRIYPALIIVMCFALWVISQFTMIDLINFSLATLDYALIFCANFKTMTHDQDYFQNDIRDNPLLHLWSLGVQEQFYIVWPFLILFIFKFWKNRAIEILGVFSLLSFVLSVFAVFHSKKFAFYFPLCRFWQMAIGGILGYANFTFKNTLVSNILSFVGLFAILLASVIIDYESQFPGFWALMPSLGCACIIQGKMGSLVNKHFLSSPPMTFIGKISYSLYLWHWPLMVYSRIPYIYGSTSIFTNMYFIIGLSFLMSILTYFAVENRMRTIKTRKVVILLIILMGLIGIASVLVGQRSDEKYAININDPETLAFLEKAKKEMVPMEGDFVMLNGRKQPNFSFNKKRDLPTSVNQVRVQMIQQEYEKLHGSEILQKNIDETSRYADVLQLYRSTEGSNTFFKVANDGQDNQLFLIGDSHIMFIAYRFQELWKKSKAEGTLGRFPTVLTALRCGSIFSLNNALLDLSRQIAKKHKPKRILFGWNWILYFCKDLKAPVQRSAKCNLDLARERITQYVMFLKEFEEQGIEVYSTGVDMNNIEYMPEHMFDSNGLIRENLKPFKYSDYRRKYKEIYDLIEGALTDAKINWIDAATNLCWEDDCHVVSPKGYAPMKDIDHMGKLLVSNWFTIFDHLVEF